MKYIYFDWLIDWLFDWLIDDTLKILSEKAVEALPAILRGVVGAIWISCHFVVILSKAVGLVAEHTWALIVFVAGLLKYG